MEKLVGKAPSGVSELGGQAAVPSERMILPSGEDLTRLDAELSAAKEELRRGEVSDVEDLLEAL